MMRMISHTRMEKQHGSTEKESTTRTLHGTGCTLSSAIPSNLAKDILWKNLFTARKSISAGRWKTMLDLGKGSGPMDHGFEMRGKFSI